eukprot:g5865.t1
MKKFHITIFGATGFTGRLVAKNFAENVSKSHPHLKWAIAGRSKGRLQELQHELLESYSIRPDVVVGEVSDQQAVDNIVGQSRVILATAGPFSTCGTPIVDACVRLGTDYVDITGETPWVRSIIDTYHEEAVKSGVRIVPMCGFDSVPSDLGTWFVANAMNQILSRSLRRCRCFIDFRGGLSGGTIATGIELESGGRKTLKQLLDPFLLGGVRKCGVREEDKDIRHAVWHENPGVYEDGSGCWTGPFVMATLNSRVVRRTAFLFEKEEISGSLTFAHGYGKNFCYNEYALAKDEDAAKKLAKPQPTLQQKKAMVAEGRLPLPGQGPNIENDEANGFTLTIVGESEIGSRVVGKVSSKGDPGYKGTAAMVSEAAVLLATDEGRALLPKLSQSSGGVLTPAFCFRGALIERLENRNIHFQIESVKDKNGEPIDFTQASYSIQSRM